MEHRNALYSKRTGPSGQRCGGTAIGVAPLANDVVAAPAPWQSAAAVGRVHRFGRPAPQPMIGGIIKMTAISKKGGGSFEGIKLLLCENPLPPLEEAVAAAAAELRRSNYYTEPFSEPLRRLLAEQIGVPERFLHINAGSELILRQVFERLGHLLHIRSLWLLVLSLAVATAQVSWAGEEPSGSVAPQGSRALRGPGPRYIVRRGRFLFTQVPHGRAATGSQRGPVRSRCQCGACS